MKRDRQKSAEELQTDLHMPRHCGKREQDARGKLEDISDSFEIMNEIIVN